MTGGDRITLRVPEASAGERVDVFLAAAGAGLSRSAAKRLLDAGRVRVGGRAVDASRRLKTGEEIEADPLPPPPSRAAPEDLPLAVVHEDDDVLVIDKPAGLVVHPAAGHWTGTLVNAVLGHARVQAAGDPLRPGIVHRIDKGTSGLLVVTKTGRAQAALAADFHAHRIERTYLAIAVGIPPKAGEFRTLYGRHPVERKRFSSRVKKGKLAVTRYRVIESFPHAPAALVEATLETGRTHQVRVHFADAGFPLLGDATYGRRPKNAAVAAAADALDRPALHAAHLGFVHPATGATVRFDAPPPADFAAALDAIRRIAE